MRAMLAAASNGFLLLAGLLLLEMLLAKSAGESNANVVTAGLKAIEYVAASRLVYRSPRATIAFVLSLSFILGPLAALAFYPRMVGGQPLLKIFALGVFTLTLVTAYRGGRLKRALLRRVVATSIAARLRARFLRQR